jgi:hypothetical protein
MSASESSSQPESIIEPYEWIRDTGPLAGSLARPLVYAFEHITLPDALFTRHPELIRALIPDEQSGMAFLHMWSKSFGVCQSHGMFKPGSASHTRSEIAYIRSMLGSVSGRKVIYGEFAISVLRTPQPRVGGETYYVALCRRLDDNAAYDGTLSPSSRYFTFEAFDLKEHAYFCEWDHARTHSNMGMFPILSEQEFLELVCSRLPSGNLPTKLEPTVFG